MEDTWRWTFNQSSAAMADLSSPPHVFLCNVNPLQSQGRFKVLGFARLLGFEEKGAEIVQANTVFRKVPYLYIIQMGLKDLV